MSHPILELDKISFSYVKNIPFIHHLTSVVSDGEFIGLLGANGSGKSTILKLASGILRPSDGQIRLWNRPLHAYRHKDRAKLLCYLPQLLDIYIPFTVRELVTMGLYPYDIPPELTVDEALELVGLQDRARSHVMTLSGGERRRVYIAMTLIQGAGLLLLDEPLANLDIKYQMEIMRLLKELKEKKNISVLMALHDINIAMQFERILLIKEGRILAVGKPESVLTKQLLRQAFDVDIEMKSEGAGCSFLWYDTNA
jgi:iron complex transport system ATP-binding protein